MLFAVASNIKSILYLLLQAFHEWLKSHSGNSSVNWGLVNLRFRFLDCFAVGSCFASSKQDLIIHMEMEMN